MSFSPFYFRYVKRAIFFLLIVGACGCAQLFPAAVSEIEPGVFRVQASGNSFASPASLRQKVESRALKICGQLGYKEVSPSNHDFLQQKNYSGSMTYSAGYQVITRYISCNSKSSE